jgi:hypothetical protein
MAISSGDKVFYYMTRESLCFLTLAEARYPKRLAFLYLDEIGDLILGELVREFGNNVSLDFSFLPKICQGGTPGDGISLIFLPPPLLISVAYRGRPDCQAFSIYTL